MYTFDGGFSKYPYLNISRSALHITPSMWKKTQSISLSVSDYTTLFSKDNYNFNELINKGYDDALVNKVYLDSKLIDKI